MDFFNCALNIFCIYFQGIDQGDNGESGKCHCLWRKIKRLCSLIVESLCFDCQNKTTILPEEQSLSPGLLKETEKCLDKDIIKPTYSKNSKL